MLTLQQAVEGAKEAVAHSLHRVGEALHITEAAEAGKGGSEVSK